MKRRSPNPRSPLSRRPRRSSPAPRIPSPHFQTASDLLRLMAHQPRIAGSAPIDMHVSIGGGVFPTPSLLPAVMPPCKQAEESPTAVIRRSIRGRGFSTVAEMLAWILNWLQRGRTIGSWCSRPTTEALESDPKAGGSRVWAVCRVPRADTEFVVGSRDFCLQRGGRGRQSET